jgi:hypothetical protein
LGNPNKADREDWELELGKALARRLPGLWSEIFRPTKNSVLVAASLSVRPWRGSYLATCKGARVDGGGHVIAFGAGGSVLEALRNCSAAVQKGQWKRDQFAQPIGDKHNHIADEPPQPLGGDGYWVGGDFQPPLDVAK